MATGSADAMLRYFAVIARTGGAIPLELSIVSDAHHQIPLSDYIAQRPDSVTLYDLSIDEIIEQIEASALDDIQLHFNVDPYQPPVDAYPSVCYVGWHPETDDVIAVFATQREQIYEVFTYASWYGLYERHSRLPGHRRVGASNRFTMREAWNPSNAPQEEPPTLTTIEANHPDIVHLFNELDRCKRVSDEAWNDYHEAGHQANLENLEQIAQDIHETAVQQHMGWSYDELDAMSTLGVGQFSNRKIDTGQIRVWLSRMTQLDGARFNHAVEVEIYYPPDGNWINLAEYPSHPDDPDYGDIFWGYQD